MKRVTLTAKAAERLDIKTVPLREEKVRRRIVVVAEVEDERTAWYERRFRHAMPMGAPQSAQSSGAGERQD